MLLKKIVVQHVENFLKPREQKFRREMYKNRTQLLVAGPRIRRDNARPHIAEVVIEIFRDYGWEVLPHAPYSPDMNPPDLSCSQN